jgi:hypothetical protein
MLMCHLVIDGQKTHGFCHDRMAALLLVDIGDTCTSLYKFQRVLFDGPVQTFRMPRVKWCFVRKSSLARV